ncbi:helix-hairpin-helix domain-containing protein [Candidatus Gracilibacteria bacterium]|nr:helix-hairpin-helix domain-containing protein [Candidatus Gracilibacteria bacterium]
MKRFLANILLFSLLFSHVGVFFQPIYAEESLEAEIVEVVEKVITYEESEIEDIIEEEQVEVIEEEVLEEESISKEDEGFENEGGEDKVVENITGEETDTILEYEGAGENGDAYQNEDEESIGNEIMQENDILEDNKNEENINNDGDIELGEDSESTEYSEEEHTNIGDIDETQREGININTATVEELKSIRGIGNATAQNIINYREISPFCDIEELLNVSGVGPARLEDIKESGYIDPTDCIDDTTEIIDDSIQEDREENGDIRDENENEILEEYNNQDSGDILDEVVEGGENTENNDIDESENEDLHIGGGGTGSENENIPVVEEVGEEGDIELMHINLATYEELITIRGIGASIAGNIIVYREENLLCRSEDLLEIRGIGPSILSNIQEVGYVSHPDCMYDDTSIPESEELIQAEDKDKTQEFSIIYEFQRPTDISPIPDSLNAYDCDRSRQDCRVNLDYRTSFSSHFPLRNYTCFTDFGFGETTGEEEKCNPNTVVFPLGVHEVSITVEEKSGEKNIYEQKFTVRNLGYLPPEKRQSLALSSGEKVGKIDIKLPRIIVQSGLEAMDDTGKFFRCLKKDCKINLDYKQGHSSERCLWDFGVGVPNHPTTHTRCNPGIVTFPEGDHELSLTVYENRFEVNKREFIFFVRNIWDDENLEYDTNVIVKNNKNIENTAFDIGKINIHLQGRIGKEKEYDAEKQELICVEVEKCSVNLIGEIEYKKRGLNYVWYKNGELLFEHNNPPAYWIETGEYEITFEIYDDEILLGTSSFFVIVEGKEISGTLKNKKKKNTEPGLFNTLLHDGLEIHDFLADPIGSDMKEFIELRNTNLEARDLYGCYLEDRAKRKFRFLLGDYLEPGEQKRFFRPQTKLTLGNQRGRIALICNNEIVQDIVWETKVREGISYKGRYIPVFHPEYIRSELSDEHYENYVKNVFGFSARALKYDGLRVSGETFPYSQLEGFIRDQRFFSLTTGASGRYTFTTKNIGAGKHEVTYVLTDMFGNIFELRPRTFTLQSQRMEYWNTPRPGSTPRTPTLRFISQANAEGEVLSPDGSSIILRRFFLLGTIIIIAFLGMWHLFILAFPPTMALKELQVRTRVRAEIIFLLPSK